MNKEIIEYQEYIYNEAMSLIKEANNLHLKSKAILDACIKWDDENNSKVADIQAFGVEQVNIYYDDAKLSLARTNDVMEFAKDAFYKNEFIKSAACGHLAWSRASDDLSKVKNMAGLRNIDIVPFIIHEYCDIKK